MLQSTLAASLPNQLPEPDIAQVIRWRDSSYSADLYIAAVSWLDLFTYLDQTPATEAELSPGDCSTTSTASSSRRHPRGAI
jgi:hypothetical protein